MTLDISKSARDSLDRLQAKQYKQVASQILELLRNDSPNDARHLSGHPGCKRIDCGEFRVIYKSVDQVVIVIEVGKRNDDEVYKKFARKA
jgi:mRNA interferase RelE/StbE